jgi:hypothetical protein
MKFQPKAGDLTFGGIFSQAFLVKEIIGFRDASFVDTGKPESLFKYFFIAVENGKGHEGYLL